MSLSFQHIRNATSILTVNGKRILIDPMLSDPGELPPIPLTFNYRRNPLTPLPVPLSLFQDVDAVLVTHRHFDHWDKKAISLLNKHIPVFCQPRDERSIRSSGFSRTIAIEDTFKWEGIWMKRIQGQHGPGLTGKLLGPVSGFILHTDKESVYIVGDCIYTPSIEEAFRTYKPDVAILNTAKAQMMWGTVITMTEEDIVRIPRLSPTTKLIAVHLETINHCKLKRNELLEFIGKQNLDESVWVPDDGEQLSF
ncbi:MBL fold metallo-hydrolase [Paenibacillus macerans]|uniref:MBL fold metallo-hydrolase n=1 Tax=Paenibacillus macerans TaxID=44252 RepID=UPI003D31B14A